MTNNNHPITPPDELVEDWWQETQKVKPERWVRYLADRAARWGYEQRGADIQKARDEELEACCEWLKKGWIPPGISSDLRTARRPLSLKKHALGLLNEGPVSDLLDHEVAVIRRALEQLDD